jgi:hypothetical protein
METNTETKRVPDKRLETILIQSEEASNIKNHINCLLKIKDILSNPSHDTSIMFMISDLSLEMDKKIQLIRKEIV